MTTFERTLFQVLRGTSDSNIRFSDLTSLLARLGFQVRIKGSHRIYSKDGVYEILNLQPTGSKAKAYQVKQVRSVILKYELASHEEE